MTDSQNAAINNIAQAVEVNDGDTLSSSLPDGYVVWTASASWGPWKSVTLGDLRAISSMLAPIVAPPYGAFSPPEDRAGWGWTKVQLEDAVRTREPKSVDECSSLEKRGLMRFVGNQHSERWEWVPTAVRQLTFLELLELYPQAKTNAPAGVREAFQAGRASCAQNDSDRKDAERYRWLKAARVEIAATSNGGADYFNVTSSDAPESLDAAIDAAMQAPAKKKEATANNDKSCVGCKFLFMCDEGYSNYTVESSSIHCALGKNPNLSAETPSDWKQEPDNWPMTNNSRCERYAPGEMIYLDVDGDDGPGDYTEDEEAIASICAYAGRRRCSTPIAPPSPKPAFYRDCGGARLAFSDWSMRLPDDNDKALSMILATRDAGILVNTFSAHYAGADTRSLVVVDNIERSALIPILIEWLSETLAARPAPPAAPDSQA